MIVTLPTVAENIRRLFLDAFDVSRELLVVGGG